MEKIKCLILGMFVLSVIMLIGVVNAEMLVSGAGVEYEEKILEEFAKLEGTNETFVKIIIELENASEENNLISPFLEEEVRNIINRPISPGRIGVEITEEGFYRLIEDERVKSIYFNRPLYYESEENNFKSNGFFIGITSILSLLVLYSLIKVLVVDKKKDKTWPYWLKGGLIFLVMGLINSLIVLSIGINKAGYFSLPLGLSLLILIGIFGGGFINKIIIWDTSLGGTSFLTHFGTIVIIISTLIFYFLMGVLIGWIYGKIKRRKIK